MAGFFKNLTDNIAATKDILLGNVGAEVDILPGIENPFNRTNSAGESHTLAGWGAGKRQQQQALTDAYQNNTAMLRTLSGRDGNATDTNGQVQSAFDINSLYGAGGGGGTAQPSATFMRSLMDQAGAGINEDYNRTVGILDSNRNFLQGQSQDLIAQTDKQYGQQVEGFNAQRKSAYGDLDRSQRDVDSNRQDAFSDLTSDLRAQMDSFSRRLGAMGAADSSAAGMGQYAFSQMGQQARSEIWKQSNKLSAEIGVRREKVNEMFNDNMRQLNNWKTSQLDEISNKLKESLQQLETAKMEADGNRIKQLNSLELEVQQQAMSSALQVDMRVASIANTNQQWAQQQTKTLDSLRGSIDQSLAGINFGAMDGTGLATDVTNTFNFGAGDIQQGGYNPNSFMGQVMLPQNRRDEDNV